jgi:LysR family hydrogen peroxide-inducible transcriptional activator
MTITQCEYIVAVDTYKNFSTAADKCFVTQPTLSMQIQKLEEELDVILFDRKTKPILTTPLGEKIIEQARIIISEHRKIKDIIKQHKGEISGQLSIGILPTIAPYLLPYFLKSFLEKYPLLRLQVE